MNIAITGHRPGFIEWHLAPELIARGHFVERYDRMIEADLVIHLAAIVGRDKGELDLIETAAVNAGLTAQIAKRAAETGTRLVYVSSSEVYMPHNLYGLSKKWGEDACYLYQPPGLTVLRLSMPYGIGNGRAYDRSRISEFCRQFLRGETVEVHDGATRSYCWVADAVRGIADIVEKTTGGAFNVGRDDDERSMLEVAELCRQATGGTGHIEVRPIPPGFTPRKPLLMPELRGLGWLPAVELEEGVKRVADSLKRTD
jgi:nucleoside-diphosphate-sugar epimerase